MNDRTVEAPAVDRDIDYGALVAGMLRVRAAFDPTSKAAIALEMGAAAIAKLRHDLSDGNAYIEALQDEEQRLRKELLRVSSVLQEPEASKVLEVLYPENCVIAFAEAPK